MKILFNIGFEDLGYKSSRCPNELNTEAYIKKRAMIPEHLYILLRWVNKMQNIRWLGGVAVRWISSFSPSLGLDGRVNLFKEFATVVTCVDRTVIETTPWELFIKN